MLNSQMMNKQRKQHGFTLLEVLIALLILSIGLLGLAALQTVGLRSNQMAAMRTQAIQTTYDITDRMRANPEGVENNAYIFALGDALPSLPVCEGADCTPTELADYDLVNWLNRIGNLPGGQGQIEQFPATSTIGITHTITVFWDEERRGVSGTNCTPDPDDLRCFSLTVQ